MADLDTYGKREEHARSLARHYGLAPHGVDVRATHPPTPGVGRTLTVVWIDSPEALIRARLVARPQVDTLLANYADPEHRRSALQWVDAAGTHWVLSTNGGKRGDEYGLWLTLSYPDDAEDLPPGAESLQFTREVERMVADATGCDVKFADLRGTPTR
jgi:hypothetical protein